MFGDETAHPQHGQHCARITTRSKAAVRAGKNKGGDKQNRFSWNSYFRNNNGHSQKAIFSKTVLTYLSSN
jgi:hypothetical protein